MFQGDYLRILSPVTSDGVTLVYENGQPKYKEDHLPLDARKHIERKNMLLPEHLRKKIEHVSNFYTPPPVRIAPPVQPVNNIVEKPVKKTRAKRTKKVKHEAA